METEVIEEKIETLSSDTDSYVIGTIDNGDTLFIGFKDTYTIYAIREDELEYYDESSGYFNEENENMYITPLSTSVLETLDLSSLKQSIDIYKKYSDMKAASEAVLDSFYEQKIDSNIFNAFSKLKNKDLFTALENIVAITKKSHGDNFRYSINTDNKGFNIYLLYPEIKISNKTGISRTLKNIVVEIPFLKYPTGFMLSEVISGTRLTWGTTEAISGYRHSHLGVVRDEYKFSHFCLGSTEIAAMNLDLRNAKGYSDLKYELFIHMIGNYLTHESLEGVPYIKMIDIKPSGSRYYIPNRISSFLNRSQYKFNLMYNKNTTSFNVLVDKTLTDSIIDVLTGANLFEPHEYMVNTDGSNEYRINEMEDLQLDRPLIRRVEVEKVSELFGIPLGLYDDKEEVTMKYELSSGIVSTVKSHLEQQINKYYKEKYATH